MTEAASHTAGRLPADKRERAGLTEARSTPVAIKQAKESDPQGELKPKREYLMPWVSRHTFHVVYSGDRLEASILDGRMSVAATVEGYYLHLTRSYFGQMQHRFLRSYDEHRTETGLLIAACAELDYLISAGWRLPL